MEEDVLKYIKENLQAAMREKKIKDIKYYIIGSISYINARLERLNEIKNLK